MAVLEKNRVKMGAFITVLIAVALLSFIIDPDTLQSTLSMFSSKNDVGEINGEGVTYQNFQKKVDYFQRIYQLTSGNATTDEQTQEMINNSAWQDEITQAVLLPAATNAGLNVGDDELYDLTQGNNISPILANEQSFLNEQGVFDRSRVAQFVQAVNQDVTGDLSTYWNFLESNMYNDQLFTKYLSLLEKSNITSPVELTKAIADNNTTYNVDFVVKPFSFMIDSTIVVSDTEIKDYYNKRKEGFKQQESRDFEYAVFEVVPSADDINYAEAEINKVYDEFETSTNMKTFLARNSDAPYNTYYYSESELESISPIVLDFVKTAKVGEALRPYKDENSFVAAKITDIQQLPDSVFVKHILLQPGTANVDSLYNLAKKGADFAKLAQENSLDQNPNVAEAGDIGWLTQQYMIPGLEEVFSASKGDILKLDTQYGTHIVKVTDLTKKSKKTQLALLVKEAVASKATYSDYYAKANELVSKAEGDYVKFDAAAHELDITLFPASRILASAKTFGNYEKAREVTRWVNENEAGAISPILTVDNKYFFVVALKNIYEAGYANVNDVAMQIKSILTMEKQGEKMAKDLKNTISSPTSLDAVAEELGTTVSNKTGVAFSSLTSQQLDSKLVGAVAGAKEGVITGPVVGDIGVYYFVVNEKEVGAFYTEDDAKQRKSQQFAYMLRVIPSILTEKAGVVDYRYKFY